MFQHLAKTTIGVGASIAVALFSVDMLRAVGVCLGIAVSVASLVSVSLDIRRKLRESKEKK